MAKTALKVTSLKAAPRTKAKKSSVTKKTLHRADGKRVRVMSLDANSPTFDSDLTTVFRLNVAKARRENRPARTRVSTKA